MNMNLQIESLENIDAPVDDFVVGFFGGVSFGAGLWIGVALAT